MKIFQKNSNEIGIIHEKMPNGLLFIEHPNEEEWNYYAKEDAWSKMCQSNVFWKIMEMNQGGDNRIFYSGRDGHDRIIFSFGKSIDILKDKIIYHTSMFCSFQDFDSVKIHLENDDIGHHVLLSNVLKIYHTLCKIKAGSW